MLPLLKQQLTVAAFREALFSRRTMLALLLALPVVIFILAAGLRGQQVGVYTRDVAAIAKVSPFTGLLSTLGLMVWAASAAVWYCCCIRARACGEKRLCCLATASVLLSLWLALDDAFMIHDALAPDYWHLPERGMLLLVACAAIAYALFFRDLLVTAIFPLAFAFGPLALSLIIDDIGAVLTWDLIGEWDFLLEDGLKWLGIVGWLGHALFWYRRSLESGG